jgi:hypothetical protein
MLYSIPVYAVLVENLGERGAEYMGVNLCESLYPLAVEQSMAVPPVVIGSKDGNIQYEIVTLQGNNVWQNIGLVVTGAIIATIATNYFLKRR